LEKKPINWTNTLFLLGTPLVALIATPWYIATRGLSVPETVTFVFLWSAIALSVTAGYHRLFSHRAYQASWPVRLFYLVFGAAAFENSLLAWSADHRIHHSFVDQEKDPYNIKRGFWWAHMGWILFDFNEPNLALVKDLNQDPLVRWQHKYYRWIAFSVGFGIPIAVGLATNSLLGCLVIACVLRIVVTHHVTFFINSLCHMIGFQPYSREHSGRDSTLMAALAFGEGYHNYHHTFPYDYRNGIRFWHFDPAKWAIWFLGQLGLAKNLKTASDVVILKAKAEVQFQRARERSQRTVRELRDVYEAKLHDAYARLQQALEDFKTAHEKKAAHPPVARALNEALREWKRALRQVRGLPIAA